jgi:hypothetical protein
MTSLRLAFGLMTGPYRGTATVVLDECHRPTARGLETGKRLRPVAGGAGSLRGLRFPEDGYDAGVKKPVADPKKHCCIWAKGAGGG